MEKLKDKKFRLLTIFILCFYAVWALFELFGKAAIDGAVSGPITRQLIKTVLIKNLCWTLPSLLILKHFSEKAHIPLKEMFTTKVNWLKYLPVFALFTVFAIGDKLIRGEKLAVVDSFGVPTVIILIFVGVTEELVFRGLLLNLTYREDKKWLCILINAVMFTLIHFPIWYMDKVLVKYLVTFAFVEIIALSVIFSLTFLKSRNILVPILLHTFWDVLLMVFVG